MIVGKASINTTKLAESTKSVDAFLKYCDSLVPKEFKHNKGIINNQRYICCMTVRKLKSVSWDRKKELLNSVMQEISIVGYTDILIEADTLFSMIDRDRVQKFVKKGV